MKGVLFGIASDRSLNVLVKVKDGDISVYLVFSKLAIRVFPQLRQPEFVLVVAQSINFDIMANLPALIFEEKYWVELDILKKDG